ncbi:MAG: antibiotic biosynthesis monooxygenase [Acidimicrobiaceae bacterium]|nr:antibiotic biosynthesis monooxygenase [Acidimicrobiaceae bacterium]
MLSYTSPAGVVRIWRGWTTPDNADTYEALLTTTIVPGIASRRIPGHRSTEILRLGSSDSESGEVEFMTIMTFDDWNAVVEFAGGDGTPSVVPHAARAVLSRFDEYSRHYSAVATFPAETS